MYDFEIGTRFDLPDGSTLTMVPGTEWTAAPDTGGLDVFQRHT
jgi:hypothetical protein